MKALLPLQVRSEQLFDPVTEFPGDIERLIAAAKAAGYQVTPAHAGELWRRHCEEMCASWFKVAGNESIIVAALLGHAEVVDDIASDIPPPTGYNSWLDYAVATLDTRSLEIDQMFSESGASISRQAMQDAAKSELAALRIMASAESRSDKGNQPKR